jgi:hypothetical protein
MDVDQVSDALPHERTRVARELLAPLEQNEVESFLGADVLVDKLLYLAQQLCILEDRELDVEDRSFLGASMLLGPSSDLVQLFFGLIERSVEALDLSRYRFVRNDPVAHVGDFPPEKMDWSVHNPG